MVQALGRQEPRAAQSSTRLAQCRHRYCNVAQPLHGVAEPMANPALTHGFDAWRRDSDACRRVTDVQPPCLTCWHRKPTARPVRVFSCLPWGASYGFSLETVSSEAGATPQPWGASCGVPKLWDTPSHEPPLIRGERPTRQSLFSENSDLEPPLIRGVRPTSRDQIEPLKTLEPPLIRGVRPTGVCKFAEATCLEPPLNPPRAGFFLTPQ